MVKVDELTHIKIEDLKVGDEVGLKRYISIGFYREYEYPTINKVVVTRITPKRTKVCLNGKEYKADSIHNSLVKLDEVAYEVDKCAKIFSDTTSMFDRLKFLHTKDKLNFRVADIDFEDMLKIKELLVYLGKKYFNEDFFTSLYYDYTKESEE